MSFDTAFLVLIVGTVVPLTMFPIVFAIGARKTWWRTAPGFATMVSTTSLGAVLWLTLARQVFGDYPFREQVLMAVFSGVCLGSWLKFGALVYELTRGLRTSHRRRSITDPTE